MIQLSIRKALEEDCRDIWLWRNDPLTRQMSKTRSELEWDVHQKWYSDVLKRSDVMILVGTDSATQKIGMCKFDRDLATGHSIVSINLNPDMRGRHLSAPLLSLSLQEFRHSHAEDIVAEIRQENIASIRCFEHCGFERKAISGDFVTYKLHRQNEVAR